MSGLALIGILSGIVKRPVPIGSCRAEAIALRSGIRFLSSSACVALAFNSIAAQPSSPPLGALVKSVVNQYCVSCHDADVKKGGLDLERLSREDITQHSEEWERVIRKMRARQMPPLGKQRPTDSTCDQVVTRLSSSLDRAAARNPNPGRTETFRRLNRSLPCLRLRSRMKLKASRQRSRRY